MRRQRTIRTSSDDPSASSWQSSPRYDARSPRSINSDGTFDRSSIASSIIGHDDPTLVHANVKRNSGGKNDVIKQCHSEALDSFLTVSFSEEENRDSLDTERTDESSSDNARRQQLVELDERQQAWELKQQERSFEMDEAGDFYLKEVGELSVLSPKSPRKKFFAPIKETIYEDEEMRETDDRETESQSFSDYEEGNPAGTTYNRPSPRSKQSPRFRMVPSPRRLVEVGRRATRNPANHTLKHQEEGVDEASDTLEPQKDHSQTDTAEYVDGENQRTQSKQSVKITDGRKIEGSPTDLRKTEVATTSGRETKGSINDRQEPEEASSSRRKTERSTHSGRKVKRSTSSGRETEDSSNSRKIREGTTSSERKTEDTTTGVATRPVYFGLSFDGSDLEIDDFPGVGKEISKNNDDAYIVDGPNVDASEQHDDPTFIDIEGNAIGQNTSVNVENNDDQNEIIRAVQERLFSFASKKWKEEARALESFDSSDHEWGGRLRSWLPTSFSNHSRGESKRSTLTGPPQVLSPKFDRSQTMASKVDRSTDEDDIDPEKIRKRRCKLLLINSCLVFVAIAAIVYSILFAMGLGNPRSGKPSFNDENNGYSNMTIYDGYLNKTIENEPNTNIPAELSPTETESNMNSSEISPSESESSVTPGDTLPNETESNEISGEASPADSEPNVISGETSPSDSEPNVVPGDTLPSENESNVIHGETIPVSSPIDETTLAPSSSGTIGGLSIETQAPSKISSKISPTDSPSEFQISSRVTPTAVSPNADFKNKEILTQSPTPDPVSVEGRLHAISGESIGDVSTPQNKAYDWLVNEDPANLDLDNLTDEELSQRYIAALLYFSLDGGNWFDEYHFLTSSHVCTWNNGSSRNKLGIICDSSDKITGFAINENNLRGQLPDELLHLSNLALFQFRANHIEGTLPRGFDKLSNLEEIDLRQNELVGSVPEAIFNLPQIRRILLLRNSQLSGTIPESIEEASNLEMLSFQKCHITGSIPTTIGNLSNLFFFTFMENLLTGSIPQSVMNLSLLEVLELSGNQLTGFLPELDGHNHLYFLSLFDNKIRGTIPSSLGGLPKLMFLDIRSNLLDGSIPATIGDLPDLVTFYAQNNQLTGTLPSFSGNKGLLQAVDLSDNQLSGNIIEFFEPGGPQDRLITVDLARNKFTGSIPASIGFYDALGDLNLEGNRFSGTIPGTIGYLTDMDTLNLGENNFSGTLPEELGLLDQLIYLNLTHNEFEWTIPDALASLSKLKVLDMASNHFVGSFSSEFNQLNNLDELYLNDNYITGDLSEVFCTGFPFGYIETFASDCLEPQATVTCECCTSCCGGENCLAF
mmetsp:Transcript_9245/g.22965  ORF Transcript_9245/g.22965 Transcript_9245/m.22965 type:complete len:1330 (-) Transcript_9245:125-4114(-)